MTRNAITFIFIMTTVILYAKSPNDTPNSYYNSIGIRASNISGSGISYSRKLTDNFSFGVQGIAFYDEHIRGDENESGDYKNEDKTVFYNYGLELRRDFYRTEASRVFALAGIYRSHETHKNAYNRFNSMTEDYYFDISENKSETSTGGGIGLGVEFTFRKIFSFNVEFGYKYEGSEGWEWDFSNNKKEPYNSKTTTLGMGAGLSFHF